jgi:NAD(P)-dependent dehydrogenase (short-subunit alcohol dehydrogenase family)
MDGISDAVVLVAGGASKIGRAVAVAFAEVGATVAVADADTVGGLGTVAAVTERGGDADFYRLDPRAERDWAVVVQSVVADFDGIDHCYLGLELDPEPASDHDPEQDAWMDPIAVDVQGVFYGLKHVGDELKREGGGTVVTTGTVAERDADSPLDTHGLVGFHRVAATAYGGHGVRVNTVQPGVAERRPVGGVPLADGGQVEDVPPRPPRSPRPPASGREERVVRMAHPKRVAAAAVWLCSDEAAHLTGYPYVVEPESDTE